MGVTKKPETEWDRAGRGLHEMAEFRLSLAYEDVFITTSFKVDHGFVEPTFSVFSKGCGGNLEMNITYQDLDSYFQNPEEWKLKEVQDFEVFSKHLKKFAALV